MHKKNKGVTLVELLLVMSIVVVLAVMMTGAINPVAMIARANDSRRKKDIGRIRVSFEDYFNDKNCYPTQGVVDSLMDEENCGSSVFSPWMNSWPCDPETKQPYYIYSEVSDCPDWFKVITNLGNENDTDIPEGWYDNGEYYYVGDGSLGIDDANYGTSSTNVNWYEYVLSPDCVLTACMYSDIINGVNVNCAAMDGECISDEDLQCHVSSTCEEKCKVRSCDP